MFLGYGNSHEEPYPLAFFTRLSPVQHGFFTKLSYVFRTGAEFRVLNVLE